MKNIFAALTGLSLLLSISAQAQVFPVVFKDGNKLFFNVTDKDANLVEVVQPGSMVGATLARPAGSLTIPATVTYKNKTYQVASIHEKAFEKADKLTFVSIPASVKEIGAQAFDGCIALAGVVFPSSETKIGKDAFRGCKSLNSLSFGSEWRAIDLADFKDSEALTVIRIPARVVKISHIKSLKPLKMIEVDSNNSAYSSADGVLYSRDGKTLYACPIAHGGHVIVRGGTEQIMVGAFSDCFALNGVTLPETMHAFSYQEFAKCPNLKSLTILGEMPPITAKWNGSSVFALRMPSDDFQVFVPDANRKRYQSAVCNKAGTYENMEGKQKETFKKDGFLTKKEIKVK
ncbi:MAG: leucine-rich repeat domain-containing protein [Bacteroidales bacterium]|nr:leucine-rich repeat domain-containing protein [Bacteroidales bacterium]